MKTVFGIQCVNVSTTSLSPIVGRDTERAQQLLRVSDRLSLQ